MRGKTALAFAWTALRADDRSMQPAGACDTARNWDEFLAAARGYFFAAAEHGVCRYRRQHRLHRAGPHPAAQARKRPQGPGARAGLGREIRLGWLHSVRGPAAPYNPAAGEKRTANNKIVPDDYPYYLTSEWVAALSRQSHRRAAQHAPKHSLDSFAAMQKDTLSLAAQDLLPLLRRTVVRSADAKAALAMLGTWNGEMLAERPEPLIFNAWTRELSRQIFADELGDELMNDYWEQRNVQASMVNVLKDVDGQSRWCRNVNDKLDAKPQTCADLLASSLDVAVADLQKRYGAQMNAWRWGKRIRRGPSTGRSPRSDCWRNCSISACRRRETPIRSMSGATICAIGTSRSSATCAQPACVV